MKPYFHDDAVTIYHGRAEEVLSQISQVSLVCTDPPYNAGKDYGVASDNLAPEDYALFMERVVCESRRLAPKQAWVAPRYQMGLFTRLLPDAHLVVIRRGAAGPYRGGWADQFETALTIGKPNQMVPDLWDDIRLKGEGYFFREETYGHPGYTPERLMKRFVSLLSEPGETVVDPFLGTGTTAWAAKTLSRKCIGIEVNERYCEIAAKRMAQGVLL